MNCAEPDPKASKTLPFIVMISLAACFSLIYLAYGVSWSTSRLGELNALGQRGGVLTLQVSPVAPGDGETLTSFPSFLEIKVTRGGLPVSGARVQFWMEGGTADAAMHNAGLAMTDSSGSASIMLLDQNTLDQGHYIWYASASKPGLRGASSPIRSFVIVFNVGKAVSSSGGTISTDNHAYTEEKGKALLVRIRGNVNHYHLGQPITLEIRTPSGKDVQIVTYGTYLGAFQTIYDAGMHPASGLYEVTAFHNHSVSATCTFYLVK